MLTTRKLRRAQPTAEPALDRRGYPRSPITMPAYRLGQAPANKGRKFPPEPLTVIEMRQLISGVGHGLAGTRNRALIVLLWRAGLRVGEALALYPRDVDLVEGRVHVMHGKGDKDRTVGIDPMACAVIQQWVDARREIGATAYQPLFCVISQPTIGQAMHAAYVRNMVKVAAQRGGIEPGRRVHPHGLRHTHAFELFGEGVRLDYIRRQLGHGDLATTARYIDHLNPAEVIEAMRARTWPT